ncbi:MAG: PIN domain-containing protein [Coriobacteriales bacterium]|nr:PIN domain-containing protein [Coriobacteriales bacterium]
MSGSAVDTNVLIRYLSNETTAVELLHGALRETPDDVFVPMAVVGEMLYGVERSRRKLENYVHYTDFLMSFPLLPVTKEIACCYAETKSRLVTKGINLPENDIWIAASAIQSGLTLLTFDQHFTLIENLEVKGIDV